jgi:peptidyl-prolyl cis-trans isomerase C
MKRCLAMLLCAMAGVLLVGCTKPPPQGQVLAQVDGTDITRRDLAIETQAAGGGGAAATALLDMVVDRTLLANAARDQGIDRTPEYLATVRRNREQLLADMYVQRIERTMPAIRPEDIADYVARHPQAFARRAVIEFRRIDVVRTPATQGALRGARDFDEAVRKLARVGAKANVTAGTLDTRAMPADVAIALEKAQRGGLAIIPSESALVAYAVGGYRATPFAGVNANEAAARSITLERLGKEVANRLQEARARSTIRFQPGLAPSNLAGDSPL